MGEEEVILGEVLGNGLRIKDNSFTQQTCYLFFFFAEGNSTKFPFVGDLVDLPGHVLYGDGLPRRARELE